MSEIINDPFRERAVDRAFYIQRFNDEVLPCSPSLDGWADWLSKPSEAWARSEAASDGQTFEASVMRFEPDIVAERQNGAWSLSRRPEGADFLAVRWAEGSGWGPDNIVWGEDMEAALLEWLAENDADCDDREHVAVGVNEPNVVLRYIAGPPPALVLHGTVQ